MKKRARKLSLKLKLLTLIFRYLFLLKEDLNELAKKYRLSSISWKNSISGEAKLLMKNLLELIKNIFLEKLHLYFSLKSGN